MQTALYLEIDAIGIAILVVLMLNRKKCGGMTQQMIFDGIVGMTTAILALDGIMWAIDGGAFPGEGMLNLVLTTAYYFLSILTVYCWLYYVKSMVETDPIALRDWAKLNGIWMLPVLTFILLNLWTGSIFYIDSSGSYQRGPFFIAINITMLLVLLAATVIALSAAGREEIKARRHDLLLLAAFPLPAMIGTAIQTAFFGMALTWVCTCISLLIIFINVQNRQIAIDPLTGLNNRVQFDRFLYGRLHTVSEEPLALIMIDIDHFKLINDTFGHLEGDKAIAAAAELLKQACRDTNVFLSRYGGDEFTIVYPSASKKQVKKLIEHIDAETLRLAKVHNTRYHFTFSIGYAFSEPDGSDTVDSLVARADAAMYAEKQQRPAFQTQVHEA